MLRGVGAIVATLTWPVNRTRQRAQGAVRPWAWGANLADNLASLLGIHVPLEVTDWPAPLQGQGTVVLAAHLGAWEAGAAELGRRGVRPLVLAAPWPRLPRTQELVARLRADQGVSSHPRSRAALRAATKHLRAGGWVVVLIDSANPRRPGRRAVPFGTEPIAAPDGLVGWAARQGAAVVVAEADGRAFRIRTLRSSRPAQRVEPHAVRSTADEAVRGLRSIVQRRPASWAWVRPLAVLTLLVSACANDPLPPLPTNPADWRADITDFQWTGALGDLQGELTAATARVRMVEPNAVGAFESLQLRLVDGTTERGVIEARTALGTLPEGPLTLRDVRWNVDGLSGELPTLVWTEQGAWSCGGCSLEDIAARLGAR